MSPDTKFLIAAVVVVAVWSVWVTKPRRDENRRKNTWHTRRPR